MVIASFLQRDGESASGEAIKSALNLLEAKAIYDGSRYELSNRVADYEDAIWYDLTDADWRAVKVTAEGWEVVNDVPILFTRFEHHAPQVEPQEGDVRGLLDFINVTDEASQILLLVYLVSTFVPSIPHPVPVLYGAQGSGKSSCFRVLRWLMDPSRLETISLPRDHDELIQKLSHNWASLFDNVGSLSAEKSDVLCRAVTGEGQSKRKLWTNDDDFIRSYRRCVGLNGINVSATRPDLLDRSILISLERISDEKMRTEQELKQAFELQRPYILGGIFTALSKAMQLLPEVHLDRMPRMADFARWGCAISIPCQPIRLH